MLTANCLHINATKRLRDVTLRVDLALGTGVTTLVGPSGAGKTTLLRLVAGLVRPDDGAITLDGVVLDDAARRHHLPPGRRGASVVFQEYALFPHLSVAENVAYGLRARRVGRAERRRRVAAMLGRLGIAALADERPGRLSGGQRQRVALARALVLEPQALLLDEPLSALDVRTRATVRGELRAILADLPIPTLLVTHDDDDALVFRERIVAMEAGQVVQDGSQADLLARPRSRFVAEFVGVNYYEGVLEGGPREAPLQSPDEIGAERVGRVRLNEGLEIYGLVEGLAPGPVGVSLRPWEVVLSGERPAGSARNVLVGRVREALPLGSRVRVALGVGPRATLPLVAEITPGAQDLLRLHEGQLLHASFKATSVTIQAR